MKAEPDVVPRAAPIGGRLTKHAYEDVRLGILDGRYPIGTVLTESELARRLGVSRTPVGHALRLLLREGLLEVGPRRQLVVREFTHRHREEVLRIRESLELLAVESASADASNDEIDRLRLLLLRQRRVADSALADEFIDLDEEFHLELARAARLPILFGFLHQLRGFVRLLRLGKVTDLEHMRHVVEEHEAIVDAIEAREAGRARNELLAHLRATRTGDRRFGATDIPGERAAPSDRAAAERAPASSHRPGPRPHAEAAA